MGVDICPVDKGVAHRRVGVGQFECRPKRRFCGRYNEPGGLLQVLFCRIGRLAQPGASVHESRAMKAPFEGALLLDLHARDLIRRLFRVLLL